MSTLNPVYVISTQSGAALSLAAANAQPGDLAILIATSNTNAMTNSATGSATPLGNDDIVSINGSGVGSGWTLDAACVGSSGTNPDRVHIYSKVLEWTNPAISGRPSDFSAAPDPSNPSQPTGGNPGSMFAVGPVGYHNVAPTRLQLMIFRDPRGFSKIKAERLLGTPQQHNTSASSNLATLTISGASRRYLGVVGLTAANSTTKWNSEASFVEPYCNESSLQVTDGSFGSHYGTGTSSCQADFRTYDAASTATLNLSGGLNNNSHAVAFAVYQVNSLNVDVLTATETDAAQKATNPSQPTVIPITTVLESYEAANFAIPAPTPAYVVSTQTAASTTITAGVGARPDDLAVLIVNGTASALGTGSDVVTRVTSSGNVQVPGGVEGWNLDQSALSASGSVKSYIFSKVLRDEDFIGTSMLAVGPTGMVGGIAGNRLQLMIFRDQRGFDPDPVARVVDKNKHETTLDWSLNLPVFTLAAGARRTVVALCMNGVNSTVKWDTSSAKDPYCDESSGTLTTPTVPNGLAGEHYGSNSANNQADFKTYTLPQAIAINFPSGTATNNHAVAAVAYQASDVILVQNRIPVGTATDTDATLRAQPDKSTDAIFRLSSVPAASYLSKKVRVTAYLAPSSQAAEIQIELLQGAGLVPINTSAWIPITDVPTGYELIVTGAITDYAELRVRVSSRTFTSSTVRISHVELELASDAIGTATELSSAQGVPRAVNFGTAIETDSAQPLVSAGKNKLIGIAFETDSALQARNPVIKIGMVIDRADLSGVTKYVDPQGTATGTGDYNDSVVDYNDFNVDYNGNVISTGLDVKRWQFADAREIWAFDVNPNVMDGVFYRKTIEASTDGPGGQTVIRGGRRVQPEMSFSGVILNQAMLDKMEYWFEKGRTINLIDDLRRTFTVYITEFTPVRTRSATNEWKHSFDCKVLVLDGY